MHEPPGDFQRKRTPRIRGLSLVLRSHPRQYLCSPPASSSLRQINRAWYESLTCVCRRETKQCILVFALCIYIYLYIYMHAQPCGSCTIKIPRWHSVPSNCLHVTLTFVHFLQCRHAKHVCLCRMHIHVTAQCLSAAAPWVSRETLGIASFSESLYSPPALQIWLNGTIKSQPSIYMITPDFSTPRFAAQWRS